MKFAKESGLCLVSNRRCSLASLDAVLRGRRSSSETHAACCIELTTSGVIADTLTALRQRGLDFCSWPRDYRQYAVVDFTWGLIWLSARQGFVEHETYQAYIYLGKALDERTFQLGANGVRCQVMPAT